MSIFDLAGGAGHGDGPAEARCSRKGCRAPARCQLLWNNPKIHTPDRRKIWLACSEHQGWLEEYLQQRGLWKETLPLPAENEAAAALQANPTGTGQDH